MKHILFTFALLVEVRAAHASGFAGCAPGEFVEGDRVSISGRGYSPKCLRVRAGVPVVIEATSNHPLQGVGEANPIFDDLGGAVSAKTVTFRTPGEFGYFCVAHGDDTGAGMAGVIEVY